MDKQCQGSTQSISLNAWCLFLKNPDDPAGGQATPAHSPNLNQPLVLQQQLNDSSVIISALKTYLVSG